MATPDFVLELRRHVGHAPLWMPGTTVVIARSAPGCAPIDWERPIAPEAVEILCVRRSDNGTWTPVTGIVDPGEEPAVAAAREALEEADVRIEVRRLLSVEVVGPVTYDNGDVTTYLDVAFVAQWVSGEPTPADGENSETAFFRGDQLPPRGRLSHRLRPRDLRACPGLVPERAESLVFVSNPLRD